MAHRAIFHQVSSRLLSSTWLRYCEWPSGRASEKRFRKALLIICGFWADRRLPYAILVSPEIADQQHVLFLRATTHNQPFAVS